MKLAQPARTSARNQEAFLAKNKTLPVFLNKEKLGGLFKNLMVLSGSLMIFVVF
jgi:hypothetical protein